jgi:hypothetical protein
MSVFLFVAGAWSPWGWDADASQTDKRVPVVVYANRLSWTGMPAMSDVRLSLILNPDGA